MRGVIRGIMRGIVLGLVRKVARGFMTGFILGLIRGITKDVTRGVLRGSLSILLFGTTALVGSATLFDERGFAQSVQIPETLNFSPRKLQGFDGGRANNRFISRLGRAQKLLGADKSGEAESLLFKLEKSAGKNDFALSQVYQTLSFLYAQKDDLPNAERYFAKVVKLEALPLNPLLDSLYALAQIQASLEKFDKSLKSIITFLENKSPPRADAFYFYAQILARKEFFPTARWALERAISLSQAPNKTWLYFLATVYFELKDYEKASSTLEKVIELEPDNLTTWKQLASVHLTKEDEKSALKVYKAAYTNGLLKSEKDLRQLLNLSILVGTPYQGAEILENLVANQKIKEFSEKTLLLIGDSWLAAKEFEKASGAYLRSVETYNSPKSRVKLGKLHIQTENWKKAASQFQPLLTSENAKKLTTRMLHDVRFHYGMALVNIGKIDDGISELEKIPESSPKFGLAETWIKYAKQK